ncbi:MAG: hypothetical protein CMJ78_24890 [Planctomycetaceae bacterium]|nr:hypothetical protein [Planctomycetaceae bacterium]
MLPLQHQLLHPNRATHAHFACNGNRLVTASGTVSNSEGQVFQWGTANGQQICGPIADDSLLCVEALDESRFATGNMTGDVRVYEVGSDQPIHEFSFKQPVFGISNNPTREDFLIVSGKTVWRQSFDDQPAELLAKCKREPALCVSPDGQSIGIYFGVTLQVVDVDTGADVCDPAKHKLKVSCSCWVSSSSVVTGSDDGFVRLYDVADAEFRKEAIELTGWIKSLDVCHQSGQLLVTVETKGKPRRGLAQCFDASSLSPKSPEFAHDQLVTHGSLDASGGLIATASADKTVAVWNSETGEQLASLPHSGTVYQASLHSSGQLVTRSSDVVNLWDISSVVG